MDSGEEEEEDIFQRKLPESVITHILSFLPTKDAIRTSILSKRWENRWTSLTKLSLHDHHQDDLTMDPFVKLRRILNFVRFVNRALLLNRAGLTMDHVSLFLSRKYDLSLLDSWFSNIFNRNVKKLQIHSRFQLSFSTITSHLLFRNLMLVEEFELLTDSISHIKAPMSIQELEFFTNSISLVDAPTPTPPTKTIQFENLKILKLCGINFNTESPRSPSCINLSFPLLTKFEARNCSWFIDADLIYVIAPLLQTISIQHEVDVRCKHLRSCIIFNHSLHLSEFSYCGNYTPQTIGLPSPCHASAKIILHERQSYAISELEPFYLLEQLSQSKSIKFEVSKVLRQPQKLCVFPMLTDLEVGLVSVDILLALLQKTPVLKTLVLKGIRTFAEELLSSAVVPDCLASLHVVKFEEVNGDDHELFLAQFFMENGMILERMCFSLASQILDKDEVMEEFKEKLSSFRNFIPDVVEFSYDQ